MVVAKRRMGAGVKVEVALEVLDEMEAAGELERIHPGKRSKGQIFRFLPAGPYFGVAVGDIQKGEPAQRTKLILEKRPSGTGRAWEGLESAIPGVRLAEVDLRSVWKDHEALAPAKQQACIVESPTALRALLDWYRQGSSTLDRVRLEEAKRTFLAIYPDFPGLTFQANSGFYWEDERGFKERSLGTVKAALESGSALSDEELGRRLLQMLMADLDQFWHFRGRSRVRRILKTDATIVEAATGRLVRSPEPVSAAVSAFLDSVWPLLAADEKNAPYADSRTLPTLLLALTRPQEVMVVQTEVVHNAGKSLLHRPLWEKAPLKPAELDDVLSLARQIFGIMKDEWQWAPRDLWDVQGFLWSVFRNPPRAPRIEPPKPMKQINESTPTNLILYGPPGTGKTYSTAAEAVRICDGRLPEGRAAVMERYRELVEAKRIGFVTFHQSYSYEDFVEGLRPETGADDNPEATASPGFRLVPRWGVFRAIAERASESEGARDPYVLIIDEINRANISKVFGELITLIEPDKRSGMENELSVTLPYSGDTFSVPSNLHIIGTMNSADRSIALLDMALRRRFRFRELMPDPGLLEEDIGGINVRAALKGMNARIEFLFDRDHQIGHAYFLGCRSHADLQVVMRDKVIPLLVEYFYEDWEKVRKVLNETADNGGFVQREKLPAPSASLPDEDMAEVRWRYSVKQEFEADAFNKLAQ
jgi:hypothetical protein